ncbi:MAG TPA: GNAT family N-acetyltransferase [Mucilaginibacter sp.]|nr:GNAT family N-acetyltransferase [Mucilaginibacter sp.]
MNIRHILKSDIDKCAALYLEAYNRPPWNYNFTPEKAVKYLTEYADRARFEGFVAEDEGKIVAAVFAHSKTWWTNDIIYIDEVFVAPDSRGRGYGKKLLSYTEDYARDKGYEVVTLMTNKHMPAFQFYNHIDYLQAEHFVFLFKPL